MSINNGMISMGGDKFYLMPVVGDKKSETDKDHEAVKSKLGKELELRKNKNAILKALPNSTAKFARQRGAKNQGKRGSKLALAHNASITRYDGPIWLQGANEQEDVQCFNVGLIQDVTAAGAVIDFTISTGNVQSVSDWASIAACFAEYRVLAMEVIYEPLVGYATLVMATSGYPILAWATDRDTSATLGSYAVAATHESCVLKSSRYPHLQKWRMNGVEEAVFTPVATAFSSGFIKCYGTQAGLGTATIGKIHERFLLQCRGKQ